MTRDNIIRMAQEAGWTVRCFDDGIDEVMDGDNYHIQTDVVERFAALIEKHLSYDGIHTCHDECQRPVCVATRKAVERERKACATIAEFNQANHLEHLTAEQIRARGEK
jgi:hypothetical protein